MTYEEVVHLQKKGWSWWTWTSNHQSLSNLAWANSWHTGTASKVAWFDVDWKATYYDAWTWDMMASTYDPAWWAKQVAFKDDLDKTLWTTLVTTRSLPPTLYDTQATYKVYEYTYWTTKYYRRVYNTYDPATDTFYTTSALTTAVCSRALSI